MKKVLFTMAVALILAFIGAAHAETLQGKWKGAAKPDVYDDWCQGAPQMQIVIKEDGSIKGSAADEDGNRIRIKGEVKDGKVDIFPLSTPIGTINFISVDEQSDERISGTWKANKGCGGSWYFEKK